jgi:hypothetical protein
MNPEFEYLMWGQPDIAEFGLRNAALFDRFISEGIFDGAADVARAEILYRLPKRDAGWFGCSARSTPGIDFSPRFAPSRSVRAPQGAVRRSWFPMRRSRPMSR